MVAGGVGLAPFITLAEALRPRGVRLTLFYGGRTSADLFCLDQFEALGVRIVLATEDGSRGELGRITVPLDRELRRRPDPCSSSRADPSRCWPRSRDSPRKPDAAAKSRSNARWDAAWVDATAASSRSAVPTERRTSSDRVREDPVFDASALVWE